jgi:hypothetical protein
MCPLKTVGEEEGGGSPLDCFGMLVKKVVKK